MRVAIVVALVAVASSALVDAQIKEAAEVDASAGLDNKINQMVWKRCALQLTPTCIKLSLARLVDRLSEDTCFQPIPGVVLVANRSRSLRTTNSESLPPIQRIDGYLVDKVVNYFRSLTMSIKFLDLPSFNTTDVFDGMLSKVTGRKRNNNGMLAIAMMLAGAMMTMMMSALAAMAGKALMTSMMALMLAAMGAMKGGGGGGGKSTTYEIIAQPEVSHGHSHSSEVQHGHWKRSIDAQWPFLPPNPNLLLRY